MLFRWSWVLCILLLAASSSVFASDWGKDDYEIFELQAALTKSEGANATFYSLLGLERQASANDIRKAYRKKSMEMHPDRNPGVADAQKRFERLGLVNKILRDERRDRYDHFLTNGFPQWRGTGYFYARFRPGLLSVLGFIVLATALVQRLILGLNYKRDASRLVNLRRSALLVAYGPGSEAPGASLGGGGGSSNARTLAGERKVRVPLQGFDELPAKPAADAPASEWEAHEKALRKAMVAHASGGGGGGFDDDGPRRPRLIEVLVSSPAAEGQEARADALDPFTGDRLSLSPDAVPRPSLLTTWPFALLRSLAAAAGLGPKEQQQASQVDGDDEQDAADVAPRTTASASAASKKKKRK